MKTRPTPPRRSIARTRRGGSVFIVMVGLIAVAVGIGLIYWFVLKPAPDAGPKLLVSTASLEPYDFTVIEQGEVESASNVELRCEVKSRSAGSSGITILEVIPEGTQVEPGDVLVKLDSSALEQERISQQIVVNTSESLVIQSQNTLDAAKIARIEYLEGTFKQEEKLILGEVFVAEQSLRSAQLSFESAQRLAAKNIVTSLQLEGSQFAVDKARNELEAAQTKLMVLRKYTKEKMLKQFDSDIATAQAKLNADKSVHQIELDKLADIDDQIAKCTIKAPMAGQVVYANKYSGRGGTAEFVVEAGAVVREQQPIIRLPDRNNMQVKALINEARVTLVRAGQPVTIRVDALKDELIQGEVVKVNQYAEPGGWSSGNIKKYAAFIKILNAPAELRTGMNTEARIHVERIPEALQVPVQALAEHRGKYFVLVQGAKGLETREVVISSTNDTMAVIKSGLGENDRVVMNPRSQPSLVLPDIPEPTVQVAEVKRPEGEIAPLRPAVANNLAATNPGASGMSPPGGPGAGGPGEERRGPPANLSPAMMITRALEQFDTDKDGKLSTTEIAGMDERFRDRYATADTNGDGFIDRAEMMPVATAAVQRIKEMQAQGGGGGFGGGQ